MVRLQAIKIVTRHNQLQTIANQAVISVIKLLRISYRRKLLKIPQGIWTRGNLTGFKESVIFSVVYVLFINRFKLLRFNWLIKLPWQLGCPQTKRKSQQSLIFSSRAYALVSRGSRLCRSRPQLSRAVTLQRKIRDCSQSRYLVPPCPSLPLKVTGHHAHQSWEKSLVISL